MVIKMSKIHVYKLIEYKKNVCEEMRMEEVTLPKFSFNYIQYANKPTCLLVPFVP